MKTVKENTAAGFGGGFGAPLGSAKRRVRETTVTGKVSRKTDVHSPKANKHNSKGKPAMAEQVLREAIRTIIRYAKTKFYEAKGQQYLQEQKLRRVIRTLLEADRTPLETTGENYAYKALDRILTGFKQAYMDMTSSKEQRDNFVRVFTDGVKKYLVTLDTQRGKPAKVAVNGKKEGGPVLNKEPSAPPPEEPTPEQKLKEQESRLRDLGTQTVTGMQQGSKDVTGANEAFDVLRTALPQIGEEYEKLSLDEDRKKFVELIFGAAGQPGSLELTVTDIESELNEKVPTTKGEGPVENPAPAPPEIGAGEEQDLTDLGL